MKNKRKFIIVSEYNCVQERIIIMCACIVTLNRREKLAKRALISSSAEVEQVKRGKIRCNVYNIYYYIIL